MQRAGEPERGEHQVRVRLPRLSRGFVPVVFALGFQAHVTAASPGEFVGVGDAEVEPDLGVEPSVSVAWVFGVILDEKRDCVDSSLVPFGWRRLPFQPFVEAGSVDRHLPAERGDRPFGGELGDHLVLEPEEVTYSFFEPPPFTE